MSPTNGRHGRIEQGIEVNLMHLRLKRMIWSTHILIIVEKTLNQWFFVEEEFLHKRIQKKKMCFCLFGLQPQTSSL